MMAGDTPDTVLASRAAQAGVLVRPLSWHRIAPGPPGLVIGYAAQPPDRLAAIGERLARSSLASLQNGNLTPEPSRSRSTAPSS
jgi:GntR family transcriptional regulator/MocR family aminotransferase